MKPPTVLTVLLAAGQIMVGYKTGRPDFTRVIIKAEEANLCGARVSLSSDNWGLQGEPFNASLVIENLPTTTTFSLSPLWVKLVIRPAQVSISTSDYYETTLAMLADQFYLYSVNISCDDGTRRESALFEVMGEENTQGRAAVKFCSGPSGENSD